MFPSRLPRVFFIIPLLIILLFNSVFCVQETNSVIILQFGEAKSAINKPGVYFKIPFLQTIKKYDNRLRTVPIEEKEVTCADNKRVVVTAFCSFCIQDVIKFYSSVNNFSVANTRMKNATESRMREVIGRFTLFNLLSSDRSLMMNQICVALNDSAQKYGLKVIDVRISKADLPDENRGAICKRMQTAREQEARKIRAEGIAESTNIFAEADKEREIIICDAYKKSQEIKSEGELEAANIYNKCYGKDPEFFKLFQSLNAYKNIFNTKDTQFILPANSKFFQYLDLGK